MKISEICREVNNFFDYDRQFGKFQIIDGVLNVDGAQDGQYVRIVGSVFNDGVYKYPLTELKDEKFDGSVWLLAIPEEFETLSEEIEEWVGANAEALNSPYKSESFGGYSYSKESGGNSSDGLTWQSHFGSKLSKWRKICPY